MIHTDLGQSEPPINPTHSLFARHAWLEDGWTDNVRLHWDIFGDISHIEVDTSPSKGEVVEQFILPGMINLHSHAFQRAMAGMTEISASSQDSFWSWRDLMYRFAQAINPDQLHAIAAQLYSECLRHGYTSICEFHYLHRAPDGNFYADMHQMAEHVMAAASLTGIGMTMLPVLYSYADFGQQPLRNEQRRFATDPDQILRLMQLLERHRHLQPGQVEIGVAPHSLRAVCMQQMLELILALPPHRPIHIHIAEQQKEVDSCLAFAKKRPVELLFDKLNVDQHWCLVHATHLSDKELTQIANSQAVVGICPSTEANLGDGFFALPEYIMQQGRFGIGSDSHVSQNPVEELRWLEYGQRLRMQRRNVAHTAEQSHIGDFLWQASLQGGAQACGRRVGTLVTGKRADLLVLDADHPNLADIAGADVLNSWIFSGNDNLVRDVLVGGKWCVKNGRHIHQTAIRQAYRKTIGQLRAL